MAADWLVLWDRITQRLAPGPMQAIADGLTELGWSGSGSGAYPVQQVTLTDNLAYTLPVGAPADQVISVVFTQNATGGHTVTYGGNAVSVDTTAGASTLVSIWPGGEVTYPSAVGSGGGVTDHGALTGLGDDDHTQYHTDARGDARYSALGHGHTLDAVTDTATRLAMTSTERTKLSGIATGATANATDAQLRDRATHTGAQAISTVTGLQSALDGKAATDHTHAGASETVKGLVELATTAEATTGTDTTRAVTPAGLKAVSDTKAPASHTHDDRYYTETEADARYLQTATPQPINAQTGTSYTLVAADAGKLVTLTNAAAITLNVPGSVFTAGQRVDCLVAGAGMVTAVGSGATVNGTPSLVSRAQWSAFTVLFTSATTAVVIGDLA